MPIDLVLAGAGQIPPLWDAPLGLDSIPEVPFSFFADFFNLDPGLFDSADHLFESATTNGAHGKETETRGASSSNTLFFEATQSDAASGEGDAPTSSLEVVGGVHGGEHAQAYAVRQQEAVHRATMEEMRGFWVDLLQFYDSSTNDYYYSCSPADRKLMLDNIVGESMTDVHLAASAYDSAAHRALVFQQAGRTAKADEWFARSRSFYRAAREMLADASTPVIARVGAINDLRLGHIWHDDPLGAQEVHQVCTSLIHAALGPRPTFTITHHIGMSSISLTTLIFSDVHDCVVNKGRRTTFEVKVDPPPANGQLGLRLHLGVPAEILWCLAETANLAVERDNRLAGRGGISEDSVCVRAEEVQRALDEWTPAIRAGLSSGELMETVATQTMWREVARIFLYSTIFGLGILSSKIRTALEEFIRASDTLPDVHVTPAPERGPASSHLGAIDPILFSQAGRGPAWFIAAMCAITPDERAVCMMGLRSCGDERIYRDNADVVRAVWEEMDRTGREVDWREWIREKGACVVFL